MQTAEPTAILRGRVVSISAFDDGPKPRSVYITTMSLFDTNPVRTTDAVFRKARAAETLTDDAVVRNYKDAPH